MDDNKLLQSIIEQSKKDAEKILEKAEQTAEERRSSFSSNLTRIQNETDSKIADRLEELKKRSDSAVISEIRRQRLKKREFVNAEIRQIFLKKIQEMIGTPEYDLFLAKLIAEGALAVDDDIAVVNCSFREKITDSILSNASEIIKKNTGKEIELILAKSPPLTGQGIVVESENGRIAYNNQIETRLRRFDEDIKGVISKWITE